MAASVPGAMHAPFSLIAELTHRCPLHCLYCSNPIEMQRSQEELSTEDWKRVFRQAAAMGVLHLHLTGGEPLVRKDLEDLIAAARDAGLYVNMITSGVGLTEQRLSNLVRPDSSIYSLAFRISMRPRPITLRERGRMPSSWRWCRC